MGGNPVLHYAIFFATCVAISCETSRSQCEKLDSHLYPAVESEAKVVSKEPLFVIEDYFYDF